MVTCEHAGLHKKLAFQDKITFDHFIMRCSFSGYYGEGISLTHSSVERIMNHLQCMLNSSHLYTEGCQSCPSAYEHLENITTDAFYQVNYSVYPSNCNCKCVYCYYRYIKNDDNSVIADLYYKLLEVTKEMKSRGMINENTYVQMSSGEFTIHQHRNILAEILENYASNRISIFTSAIKFDNHVAELVSNGASINCSLDASDRNTYRRIKQLDKFDAVCETIYRYNQIRFGSVEVKYIVIPGYNDSDADLIAFMELMQKLEIQHISFAGLVMRDSSELFKLGVTSDGSNETAIRFYETAKEHFNCGLGLV